MPMDHFIRLADSLVEFDYDLTDNRYPLTSLHAIDLHRSEIKTLWSRIKAAYEKFLFDMENGQKDTDASKSKDQSPADLESFKVKYKSTYITYCNCLAKLSELHDAKRHESLPSSEALNSPSPLPSSAFPENSRNSSNAYSFHLPPCDIEVFNGDYMGWPTFRDMFTAIYINNSRLSQVEKLFHLTNKTTDEARDIVKKSPLTHQGFELAWSSLCARFENRRVLVNGQLKLLFNLPSITSESGLAIKQLQRDITSCISTLKLYDIDVDSWDPLFVFLCSNCLPDNTLHLWEHGLMDKTSIPKWSDLDNFLTNRHRTLESVHEIRNLASNKSSDDTTKHPTKSANPAKKINSFQTNVTGLQCPLCPSESHIIRKCPKFLQMSQSERFNEIKRQNLCLNCFSKAHTVKNCSSKYSCYKCGKRHNTLLHKDSENSVSNSNNANFSQPPSTSHHSKLNPNSAPFSSDSKNIPIQSTTSCGADVVQTCFASNQRGVLLGTAMVNVCYSHGVYEARALIDSGSEGTFISDRLFNELRLPATRISARISGLNNTISANVQRECSFTINSPIDDNIVVPVKALVVPHLAGDLPSRSVHVSNFDKLPPMKLADPQFHSSSQIDILIGGDIIPSIMLSGIQHNICGSLMAQETIFGWILTGPISTHSSVPNTVVSSFACEISLDKEISRFWEVENLPQKSVKSTSDQYCEDLFARTTKRNKDGRYVVALPFREGYPTKLNIGQSKNSSMAQFYRNEARLLRTPTFKEEYDRVLEEYIRLDHMVKVPSPSISDIPMHFYLPHHAVIKPESSTTKVRVVFNASASSSNGLSLNDILHTGPVLQNDLTLLILKWRFFQYVFNADIQKMYRQILVDPQHTPFQRIVFRKNPSEVVQDYELKTVTFGVNCAPYLAIRTLIQLADDVQSTYPLASNILRTSMYVDDALAGAYSITDAKNARNELILALESAGFSLRKWTANSKEVIADLPPEHLLNDDFLDFDDSSKAKTLGVRWNARSDYFYFVTKPFLESSTNTKREVLSQIARLFDPAGWLSPCVVIAKILMQRIWIEGTDWDDILSPESLSQWKTFQSNYSFINEIRIPRWIDFNPNVEVQFHGFCDASEKAYAAALYIRIANENSISTHLVSSKTRVAPVKTLSIPRLELCGAVLLAEMIDILLPRLEVDKYSVFCWTDSSIVLSWLAKPPCSWLTFVANRISKIVEIIDPLHWYHVPSEDNPADLASRGVCPQDIIENELWWNGPKWLKQSNISSRCSESQILRETDLERKTFKVHFTYFQNFDDVLERFSSFPKAMRVMSYVYRFFYRTHPRYRSNFSKDSYVVTSCEIRSVRDRHISMCQKAWYPNEYKALSSQKTISSSSPILNLNPFLDPEGLIRSCGRLESSPGISYYEKNPIILPYACQYARLLVQFVHSISLHGGNQLVLRIIRSQYWIPRVKNLIKATINKCKPCLLYKKKCQKQIMAALPPERSEISRPFTHTGLDFAGPFDIKTYAGRACRITKGYVCVFICFSTKAIHLEPTSDLSTSSFLGAFSRFVSRRGCPLHLHSDNGTTFVGASKILAKEFLETSRQAITANYAHQNITWHFIPPGAPHMGGLWEAGVKSFKSHFRKITGSVKYTYEEFATLLSKIEACLNSRPLSPISQDPLDLSALTPGHFLIGSPILAPIDPQINESALSIRNRWQRMKLIHQNFCTRWKTEYLKELQKRTKWKIPQENLNENALVVIKDENLPPNSWRLGRVSKVYVGSDNRVRVADVLTQRGVVTRPITKLIIMPKKLSNENTIQKHRRHRHDEHSKLPHKFNSFLCRICNRPHPLRTCRKFLAMNVRDRIRAVRTHKYCSNCLAHNHSQGTCFSKHGCRKCKKFHHTLLHMHPRLADNFEASSSSPSSRSRSPSPPATSKHGGPSKSSSSKPMSKSTSLTAILRQNRVILLPTVLVKINNKTVFGRCLLDSGSSISRISKTFVAKHDLTTLTLQDETICPLTVKSRFDTNSKIDGTFRVDNRLTLLTPTQSLPEKFKDNFRDIFLADPKFYESSGIDIIIGVDLYPNVICEGVISKTGLPTAQSIIFGWTIYGSCST